MLKKILILTFLFILLITSGFGCKVVDKKTREAMQPITIKYWRVWDGPDAFEEIINKYNALHPFITIEYKKLRYNEYELALLEAMAEDKSPDIFSIHNTWIQKYKTKIVPMPDAITMAYPIMRGSIKKEIIPELRTKRSLTIQELKNNFVDAIYNDVLTMTEKTVYLDPAGEQEFGETRRRKIIKKENILGLPLSVDTLVMYYNRDLLNNAGIITPFKYWNKEFQQGVKALTKLDAKGNIIQSGVSLGGGKNIERAGDILSVLMMQNGAIMINDNGIVMFDKIPFNAKNQTYNPGLEAFRFYVDFANPAKEVYAWNKDLPGSVDMFVTGKLAMMFGYAYHLPIIKTRAPKLNFSIVKLPQIEGNIREVNFANYWVEVVSKKSKHVNEAWDFIQFMTKAENVRSYLNVTKKPTALRTLIKEQKDDIELSAFVDQLLTAKSWYKGAGANAAEKVFNEMVENALNNQEELENILKIGASQIQQTIKK